MPRAESRLRKYLSPVALGAACLLLLAATASTGSRSSVQLPEGAIHPTPRQQEIAQQVASNLEHYHYSRRPIDKEFGAQVFDRYLNGLDGQHSYFLAADVASMTQWRSGFDDMIHTASARAGLPDVQAVPAAQSRAHRLRAQACWRPSRTGPLNESFTFDRDKAPWPRDVSRSSMNCGGSASRTTRSR
jgi:hypothetical protein